MRRSALINVMEAAARKAARCLVRDFGEVEQLQVSEKGPADFVSEADRRTEAILTDELRKARPTFGFLREEQGGAADGGPGGVFHCFTETAEVARAALDMGFLISFSGILTFRNAADLREVARFVPLDRCLIETDSPYLAPVPYRGKTNSPAYVPHVTAQVAAVKGLDVQTVADATSRNFERLFKLPQPETAP